MLEVAIVLLCTVLITMVEHYTAAWYTGGRMWPRIISYVLGVLSIMGPVSGWLIWRWVSAGGQIQAVAALIVIWLATVIAGITVLGMYLIDDWLRTRREVREGGQRERIALDMALGQHRDTND